VAGNSAIAVANAFIELAKKEGKQLTNMQLQKLVYVAHGWCLALLRKPLFYNDVKAWPWGPVIPSLYNRLKKYGKGVVSDTIPTDHDPVDPHTEDMSLIKSVWDAYKEFDGLQLSAMTHTEGTPWAETWKSIKYGKISDESIAQHYRQLADERIGTESQTSG
jgi:uncharacterized phage-associated protein